MIHKGTVTLETERLILRRFELSDVDAMFNNWANDAEVTKFLTWPTHSDVSVSKAVIDSWLPLYENPNYYSWAIVLKEIGEPIGSIAAVEQRDDIKMVHIGYCIGRKWWRQGYTSEALAVLIRFFFEDVGVNRIESRHDPRNPNSGKVMLKCGLKYEGTLRQSDINNQGGFCDAAYNAILAEDYSVYKQAGFSFSIGDISIDCRNPDLTRDFYHSLTGWEKRVMYGCPAIITENGLVILFMQCDFDYIPPVWPEEPGKQQKQMHFNFQVSDLPAAVEEAIKLGATKAAAQYGGEHFITMFDPEGHPFCLCRK